ncbi:MAG: YgiT-type zinc finger protein [Deltaproteobacteria bacterium]|nr:YgiT-type zinc finger protein [Deltaproteobacteria bacterium]
MKKERCANCGGKLLPRRVEYEKIIGRHRALFDEVPANVCLECDEIWLDGKIAEKMERLFYKGAKPTRKVTIPVWSLAKVA